MVQQSERSGMRCLSISIVLAVLCATAVLAAEKQEVPPRIKAYLEQRPTSAEKTAAIKDLQKKLGGYRQTLARIRRGRIRRTQEVITVGPTGVITFPSQEAKSAKVKQAQEQVTAAIVRVRGLRNGTAVWFARMNSARPTVGEIGRLPDNRLSHIKQIIGPQDMRISTLWWGSVHWPTGGLMLDDSTEFWVKGVSTRGLTNRKGVMLSGVFEITGAKTYTTAIGGSNTVFVIEPIDLTPYLRPKRPRAQVAPKPVG